MMMKTKLGGEEKSRAEREMNLATDLLAEAGLEEPKILFGKISSGTFLKSYLILCTVNPCILDLFTNVLDCQFIYDDGCEWETESLLFSQISIH